MSPEASVVGDMEIRGKVAEGAKEGVPVLSFETQQNATWGHVGLQAQVCKSFPNTRGFYP